MKKKNKKIIKISILISAFTCLIALIIPLCKITFSALNKGMAKLITPQKIEFSIDHIYSKDLIKDLTEFVTKNTSTEKLTEFNPQAFYKKLKAKFKIIKKIEWDFTQPQIAKLKLQGTKPFGKINNKFVLGNKKRLFHFDHFKDFDIENLKNIQLSQEYFDQKINPETYSFLNNISPKIWTKYALTYYKDWAIILEKKNKKNSVQSFFLFDKKHFFNSKKMLCAKLLIKKLKKDWGNRFFWRKIKLFDLRFKDRILYRPLKIKPWGRG